MMRNALRPPPDASRIRVSVSLRTIPQDEYLKLREDFINYSAKASIGYGIEEPNSGVPVNFFGMVYPKEPSDVNRFSVAVIEKMCEMRELITVDTALNTITNGFQIALADLIGYADIGFWWGCYKSLEDLYKIVCSTDGVSGDLAELCSTEILPFRTLSECLEKADYSDEEQDRAAEHWIYHDPNAYLDYYYDAKVAADDSFGKGALTATTLKRRIKEDMENLVSTYFSHI